MIRRTLLLTMLLQTLLGSGVEAPALARPATRGYATQRPTPYRNVGSNPRGTPVLSWQDALSYMQSHPKFQQDLTELLPQGLSPEVRAAHWPRVVSEVRGSVETARAHQFMGGACPVCTGRGLNRCERAGELSHRFQRLAIPRGTQYLALTEGEDGRVTFNRVFLGDAIAYRVSVLDGRGFIDLIARCRNTALGQRSEWETYTAFTPSAPPTAQPLPEAPAPPQASAGYIESRGIAPGIAPVLPPVAYIGPGQPQFYHRDYRAGNLALWFRPDVTVRVNQTAPTAVGGATGEVVAPPSPGAQAPSVVVGPSTFQTPVAPAGSGSPIQAPVGAAGGGSPVQAPVTLPSVNFPTQAPAQGSGSPQQGPAQR
jgi:hypothetical protein